MKCHGRTLRSSGSVWSQQHLVDIRGTAAREDTADWLMFSSSGPLCPISAITHGALVCSQAADGRQSCDLTCHQGYQNSLPVSRFLCDAENSSMLSVCSLDFILTQIAAKAIWTVIYISFCQCGSYCLYKCSVPSVSVQTVRLCHCHRHQFPVLVCMKRLGQRHNFIAVLS